MKVPDFSKKTPLVSHRKNTELFLSRQREGLSPSIHAFLPAAFNYYKDTITLGDCGSSVD